MYLSHDCAVRVVVPGDGDHGVTWLEGPRVHHVLQGHVRGQHTLGNVRGKCWPQVVHIRVAELTNQLRNEKYQLHDRSEDHRIYFTLPQL